MSNIPLTNEAPEPQVQTEIKGDVTTTSTSEVEVPYRDYHRAHGKPYLVDHFNLGNTWNDPEGGFPREIQAISMYVDSKIESGEIANSISAVKNTLKDMEKFNNLNKEERSVVKLEVLSHYVEFLQKNERTKQNLRRYHG